MGGMHARMCAGGLLAAALVSACETTSDRRDLALNSDLYAWSGVRASLPGDRPVYIAAFKRDTSQALPASDGAWPIQYQSDSIWERAPEAMLFDVMREEVERSGIFTGLLDRPTRDSVVIQPHIIAFNSGYKEQVEGSKSLASFTLRLEVYGPDSEGNGQRIKVMDDLFPDQQASSIGISPPEAHKLLALAVRSSMSRALQALDSSSVSRQGMPLVPVDED